ncbi:MAG: acyl-CoA dehydrogenase [Chloroflexi bacterium 13_1_40CM_4_65_16]|nr:MAG: acyl-CoA dehydrogenase [Chloroflexi bacterium 13_1_40CM_66_19]OLC48422.1 MAG: acyl-CoA dehydrogenase [Chloroflexi bacterium 13_1_40CM_4_65_16]OLD05691.1 MAG: acyl-CoA dehydrogenase [Actinobacteria bacterium 13_1_40CM_3_66_19]OLE72431.1 MAG: acyl-CoA dehydrogenase [Actinobacteria bacterium 13_1_20CM_2_66_18]TMF34133.1 MAG: acyl-CoA dehydrogenase [Chloroflexota bacterium]
MYFTDAHEELRLHIRRFLEKEVQPHLDEWEEKTFPDSIFQRFGELGFLGLRYPPEYGGQGGDYFSALVLSEELARAGTGGLGMAVAVQTEMATPPVFKFGTEEQKTRWLAPAIRGEQIASIAITEPDAGSDVAGITTVARRFGDEFIVSGRKTFITNGARCHWALVVTKNERERGHAGYNLLVIEKGTPGFEVSRTLKKLGMHSSDTAELLFDDCHVPASNLIGEEGEGFKQLMWELQGERMITAAGAIAGANRVFEYTMEYARNRQAFGQPISNFQVIKHKLVDMGTKIAAIQAFVYQTAKQWDEGEYPVREISQAKLLATQVACDVADEAIQILGGHGYMREFPVERAWRDARLARIGAGTDEIMKEIIAKSYGL